MYRTPEKYKQENDRLAQLYLDRQDETISIDDIVKQYASDEYKKYHAEVQKFFDEMEAQGIAV